ncbi:MAG: hypothetical protein AAF346_11240 [Pseudomonadota bacterium]
MYFLSLPALPEFMRKPGSPAIYLFGAAGSALLLVAAVFVFVKRTGRGGSPVNWFIAHVICSNIGFVLVAIHTTGKLDQMPALLLLNLVALMALGIWARLHASRAMADTFGNKLRGFSAGNDQRRAELKELIERKSNLLTQLDPDAHEATFSVALAHYFRRPFIALAYQRLVQEEQQLIGARASVGWVQAWWRPLHLTLAATFVLGLLIHVVMVTFFAGYVADGGPVTWWHVSAWDF